MLLENVSSTLTSRITRFHQFIWLTVLTGLQTSSLALPRLFWDAEHHQSAGRSSCNDFHFPRNGTLCLLVILKSPSTNMTVTKKDRTHYSSNINIAIVFCEGHLQKNMPVPVYTDKTYILNSSKRHLSFCHPGKKLLGHLHKLLTRIHSRREPMQRYTLSVKDAPSGCSNLQMCFRYKKIEFLPV